jgi:flagellar basal body rod protein FlgB
MALLNNTLSVLLNQRITWLNARGNILVSNVANADTKSATRKELRLFKEIVEGPRKIKAASQCQSDMRWLKINNDDVITTNTEISREIEMLEVSNNALEHDSVINLVRNFHRMMRNILGKGQ